MRRSYIPLIAGLVCFACGGEESGVGISIERSAQALLTDVSQVRINLYTGVQSCEVIRLSGARVPGAYAVTLSVAAGDTQGSSELFDVVAATYTAAVWGFDGSTRLVAFGCTPSPVVVENGKRAELTIELKPTGPGGR